MRYIIGSICIMVSSAAFSQSTGSQTLPKPTDPIVVVDGKVLPAMVQRADSAKMVRAIDSIDGKNVDKIEVLNGSAAVSAYGDAGKNGVILITLKKKSN